MKEIIHQTSGILMTICYLFCSVPQIIKIIKTKSAKDISIGFLGLSTAGHIFATVYASFGNNNVWTFICCSGSMVSSSMLVILWNKYSEN